MAAVMEAQKTSALSPALLETAKDDFKFVHYVRSGLQSVEATLRPVAVQLLSWGGRAFGVSALQEAWSECAKGTINIYDAAEIGDQLVLANFLVWQGRGSYKVYCPALKDFV